MLDLATQTEASWGSVSHGMLKWMQPSFRSVFQSSWGRASYLDQEGASGKRSGDFSVTVQRKIMCVFRGLDGGLLLGCAVESTESEDEIRGVDRDDFPVGVVLFENPHSCRVGDSVSELGD